MNSGILHVFPSHAGAIRSALAEVRLDAGILYICRGARSHCDGQPHACQFCYMVPPEDARHWAQVVQGFVRGDA